jgi:hypothetical protein
VDIRNVAERETFTGELLQRYGEVRETLASEECKYVEQVIHRLSAGITDTMGDGIGNIRWPDENLLCEWIEPNVIWTFVSQSELFGEGWDTLNFIRSKSRVNMLNEFYPICGMSLAEIISILKGHVVQIKFRDRHFYVVPSRHLDSDDIGSAVKDLVNKLLAVVTARSLVIADNNKRRKDEARDRKSFRQRERNHVTKVSEETKVNNQRLNNVAHISRNARMSDAEKDFISSRRRYERHQELVDNDAASFRQYVDNCLVFEVCSMCAYEGLQSNLSPAVK